MFQREYTVQGTDVNDFMVMQSDAYLKYASKIVETFLFVKGYTKLKMNTLKVGLQKQSDQLNQNKPLLFTQKFTMLLEFKNIDYTLQKMTILVSFYNSKNEPVASLQREFSWFDYSSWQVITPPKVITKYFKQETILNKAS
ncbi:thioesterase family protein [Polaribacter porphyrae]|uniref:Uncharacterized protein n=1 Tax=Polaribacter porphyrae TaxID=1137780 RepID=A0A2S7WL74_9FLAO|nr:thioesterase family protein [Polaribacter porphyrae]PQJ78360.1 hypothetical protein BTO18_03765 [Polaribacter porphyrae]